ncbi:MAG: DNA repair protein RecN [Deltaproteobacteria bacterium]|nr:DNA repair protein RecN [Deltaproteobacteria bacterium]
MLSELVISNLAIIDRLHLAFESGLNVISGETGAGKSIIISAVNLILGGRATQDMVRSGADAAEVQAMFLVDDDTTLGPVVENLGLDFSDGLVIRRVISGTGRSRAYINGQPATLNMLETLTSALINISGQHEHQSLLNRENHLDILDQFAASEPLKSRVRETYNGLQTLTAKLNKVVAARNQQADRLDLLTFQLREIDSAGVRPNEDDELEEERHRLIHAEKISHLTLRCLGLLYDQSGSVMEQLAEAGRNLEKITEYDSSMTGLSEQLESARYQVEDVSAYLRDYSQTIVFNPERLEQVEERLSVLTRLKRKYGPTLQDVLSFHSTTRQELDDLAGGEDKISELDAEWRKELKAAVSLAEELSRMRLVAAEDFTQAVQSEIRSLGMLEGVFAVRFEDRPVDSDPIPEDTGPSWAIPAYLTPKGMDEVEFFISPNPGEELKPLAKIASGGELSRILLGVKKALAQKGAVETLVFDEVDTGIDGQTARVVGQKLKVLSNYHQVLCITHLPQIAGYGQTHFRVEKMTSAGRTVTTVKLLDKEERVEEIARMLGGAGSSSKTLAHAREIIAAGAAFNPES